MEVGVRLLFAVEGLLFGVCVCRMVVGDRNGKINIYGE